MSVVQWHHRSTSQSKNEEKIYLTNYTKKYGKSMNELLVADDPLIELVAKSESKPSDS